MREEVENEEETSSFSVPKVDKSWKDLEDWRPGEVIPSWKGLLMFLLYVPIGPFHLWTRSPHPPGKELPISSYVVLQALLPIGRASAPAAAETDVEQDISSASEEEPDLSKEGEKVLKQLGFPQVESTKFNPADFPKVARCINKRVTKLAAIEKQLDGITTKTDQQSSLPVNFYECIFCLLEPPKPSGSGSFILQSCLWSIPQVACQTQGWHEQVGQVGGGNHDNVHLWGR